jgi:hypothetical protein
MILICTASSDTYITNKIVNNNLVVSDTNVGRAATLDLFKLYNETTYSGSTNHTELSRILIKFDLQHISDNLSKINLNSSSFKATLKLYDIISGNPTPSNFNVTVNPLSQSFDEGVGRDTISFNDIDVANFITASYTSQANLWFASGANSGGLLGSDNIDYISSGNLGSGVVDISASQNFFKGTEDLSIDVTQIVSATIAGIIPDKGFRICFAPSEETDQKTRFVKRFASRHVSNPLLRPKILIQYNDSIKDSSKYFTFDSSGTLFLQTFIGSTPSNIVSGSSLTPVTGLNSLILTLNTGTYNFIVTGSQHFEGTNAQFVPGVYSASFAIPSNLQNTVYSGSDTLANIIATSGSVNFTTYWKSLDNTFGYYTGSLLVTRPIREQANFTTRNPLLRITNANPFYTTRDKVRFRVFGVDLNRQFSQPVKRARRLESIIYDKVYYQVFDRSTGNVIIPYDSVNNSTLLSTDSQGMFFDFYMQSLIPGRSYGFQFYVVDRDQSYLSKEDDTHFDVRP